MLKEVRHIFKLDPARELTGEEIERICTSGTEGIIVGGTDGVTFENTYQLLRQIEVYSLPVYQEISTKDSVVLGFDGYLIPLVLNAQNPNWILEAHQQAIKTYGSLIPWQDCRVEGYIVLNPNSKVAKLTEAKTALTDEDVIAYARLADQLLKLPYVYLEYSGCYGDARLVEQVKAVLGQSHLIYGGGIDSLGKSMEMAASADTIVVGNVVYEDLDRAIETVKSLRKV